MQQFNEKGHPTSKTTDIQNRRLRRAQNEVLKLAGVVKSKHDEAQPDQWTEMPNEKREDTIKEENQLMRLVRPFDNLILDIVTSWVYAFRRRVMVSNTIALLFVLMIADLQILSEPASVLDARLRVSDFGSPGNLVLWPTSLVARCSQPQAKNVAILIRRLSHQPTDFSIEILPSQWFVATKALSSSVS